MPANKKITSKNVEKKNIAAKQPVTKTARSIPQSNGWFEKFFAPQIVFLFLSAVFGICFLITIPPYQNPDEIAHFERVYKLAEFKTLQRVEEKKWGDDLPVSIDSSFSKFDRLRWRPYNKTDKEEITSALKIPLNKEQTKFSNIDAGGYFYFSYLPQLPAVFLGKMLNLNVLYIFYLGRLFALAFYVLCVFYAIKTIPVGKYLLTAIAVMPTCLAQASSFNADCVLFSLSFLMIAILLKQIFVVKKISMSLDTTILFGTVLILGIMKIVYVPLGLLLFLLPVIYFKTKGRWITAISIAIILSAVFGVIWLKSFGAVSSNINPEMATTYGNKVTAFKHDPFILFEIVKQSFSYFHIMYYHSIIGLLGYLDTVLPEGVYTVFLLLIIALTLFGVKKDHQLSIKQRLFFFFSSVGVILAVILAMYLITPDRPTLIADGVQGRYFIPALFPFMLSFHGIFSGKMDLSKYKILVIGIVIILLGCLVTTEFTLIDRYFG